MNLNHESHCHVHLHEVLRSFPRGSPYLIDHVMCLYFLVSNDQQVVQHMRFNPWYPSHYFSTDTESYLLKLLIPSSTINPYYLFLSTPIFCWKLDSTSYSSVAYCLHLFCTNLVYMLLFILCTYIACCCNCFFC